MKEFSGYDFDYLETRERMKYIVIESGDLDLNGAYAFENKRDLTDYLEAYYDAEDNPVLAIFEVKNLEVETEKTITYIGDTK